MNAPLFFESAGDERATPKDFFDTLDAEFHFDIDCAASRLNHKCELYFGEGGVAFDALETDWAGQTCFLNPPYSVAAPFIDKAREEADKGATVVLLLPVRSDTKWWHKHIWDAKDILSVDGTWRPGVRVRFVSGRISFELNVPAEMRTWIRVELKTRATAYLTKTAVTEHERAEYAAVVLELVKKTGLPKMAIERIWRDLPDEDLLEAAPFPSCVAIFTKV